MPPKRKTKKQTKPATRKKTAVEEKAPVAHAHHFADAPSASWKEWMNLRTNLAWVSEGPVAPETRKGHYNADHLGAWLILRGNVVLKQPGKTVTAGAGEWVLPWPGERYQEFSEDACILSVRFNANWPDGKPLFENGLSAVIKAADFPLLEKKARLLLISAQQVIPGNKYGISTATIPFESFFEVKEALLKWVNEYWRTLCAIGLRPTRVGIRDERVVKALQCLDMLPLSAQLRENNLAAESGLGVSQFVRIFREQLDETPKQYFDHRRHEYCRQMLANSNVPIKEIAYNLGFSRLSDFSAWVKNQFNVPPRVFRENNSNKQAVV